MMRSSSDDAGEMARGRALGVAACLVKPVRQKALREAMLSAMGRTRKEVRASQPETGSRGTPLRILVAEDNIVNQRVATAILQMAGHMVTIAESGEVALAMLG